MPNPAPPCIVSPYRKGGISSTFQYGALDAVIPQPTIRYAEPITFMVSYIFKYECFALNSIAHIVILFCSRMLALATIIFHKD